MGGFPVNGSYFQSWHSEKWEGEEKERTVLICSTVVPVAMSWEGAVEITPV